MKITFVKKIKTDGSPCKKCVDVERRLIDNNQMDLIDDIVIADERDENSPGMLLASTHKIEQAPFFLVENEQSDPAVYTIYFQFVKEILEPIERNKKASA